MCKIWKLGIKTIAFSAIALVFGLSIADGQSITTDIPEKIDVSKKYIIYLHGAIVQQLGAEKAVSPKHGRYEYNKILEAFRKRGFNVISEVRPKNTDVSKYAVKVSKQVKTLQKRGVSQENIILVGASLGAYITIEAADILKKEKVKFVLIGLCSEYALGYYSKHKNKLRGNFLSIYESSDEKGSCKPLFNPKHRKSKFAEVKLNMGNGHGFLYKPYDEWVIPLVNWANNNVARKIIQSH